MSVVQGDYFRQANRNFTLNVTGDYDLKVDGDSSVMIGDYRPPSSNGDDNDSSAADTSSDQSSSDGSSSDGSSSDGTSSDTSSSGASSSNGSLANGGDSAEAEADPLAGTLWGHDKLTVRGNASFKAKEKTIRMKGVYQREWYGGIVRMAGMEGIICGGAFIRTHIGPSVTLSMLSTGDVYGGAARTSVLRSYIAAINYRSTDMAAWATYCYVRRTRFTIEPAINSPSKEPPKTGLMRKAGRLAMALCPFLDIGVGMVMMPKGIWGLIQTGYQFYKKKPGPPPSGPPRLRFRSYGVRKEAAASVTET